MHLVGFPWLASFALGFYLALVRLLRYRRISAMPDRYGMHTRSDFARMTADQAQDIILTLVGLEFPKLMGFSIVFALFKTYGISTISSLLAKTGEMATTESTSRRIADTGVLILEFCLNRPSSQRALEATARMNYLHSHYIKAGKIYNNDMLYTLSVFALEPARWVNEFEWRQLTSFELCALGTFWKSMGDRMEIDMSALPGADAGWKDGLEWFQAVQSWSSAYEEQHMVPAMVNHDLVTRYLDVVFLNIPEGLRAWFRHMISALGGPRLTQAMMLDCPPPWLEPLLFGLLHARKLVLRHFALPRYIQKTYISDTPETNGRYSSKEYLSHPWYVKPTFSRRWSSRAWLTWLLGRKLPGDDGDRYKSEGYNVSEVGPDVLRDKGIQYMRRDLARLRVIERTACPFHTDGTE